MTKTICYTTILTYSVFSFLFMSICPAACFYFVSADELCETICSSESDNSVSRCSETCESPCSDIDPTVYCSLNYESHDSYHSFCSCPLPDKTPATRESGRLLKDIDQSARPLIAVLAPELSTFHDFSGQNQPSKLIATIISTTVLRI